LKDGILPGSGWYLLVALGMLVAGAWLGVAQPVWLAPPWMRLTPFVYLVFSMLWLIPGLNGLWLLLPGRRLFFTLLLIPILAGQCCLSLVCGSVELGYVGMYGGPHPMLGGHFTCETTAAPTFICELCIVSSDNPAEIQRTYTFGKLAPLLLLRLVDVVEKSSDQWSTPPCSDL
jgi:hypothetical protein